MTPRQSMIAKVQALLAKTVENGCTEGEAMAALEKARQMMAAHGITDDDLAFGGEEVTREKRHADDRHKVRRSLPCGVAAFCSCRAWREEGGGIVFCGLQSDAVFAHWLLDMLERLYARALADYLAATPRVAGRRGPRRIESNGFMIGFCNRVNDRLRAMAPASREIVAAKNELIEANLAGIRFQRPRSREVAADQGAIRAGEGAGDRAQFVRPIGDGVAPISGALR